MDRLTAVVLLAIILVVGYLFVYYVPQLGKGMPVKVTVESPKYPVDVWTYKVKLKEGIGPNTGQYLDGTVTVYGEEITDVYDIPSDALVLDTGTADDKNGVIFEIDVDPESVGDEGMPVWFVGEATGYYKALKKDVIPKEATTDEMDATHNVVLTLDKVATLTWTADDAYRGTDNPVLRWKTTDEVYKTVFYIKPSIDFETDKPSGVFIVKRVSLELNSTFTESSEVDSIDATFTIGDAEIKLEDLSTADLPESEKLESYATVSTDSPMEVQILVYTVDGTASLTSDANVFDVSVEDVLDNEYTVTVKVA